MTVELGHFALALALGLAVAQFVVPLWGALRGDARLMSVASGAATGQFVFVALAFGALVEAHAASDFSVRNVYENSHTLKPLIYKITGVWGSHEGSMLLWILILALFGAMVARGARGGEAIRSVALSLQGALGAAFIAFVLATSDPFQRLWPAPREGQDLNPLLQDPGLAIHPPLLYLGYVGFSVAFSFAGAALILGRFDAAWTRAVRPWALLAWTFLTLGIAMGSYWAYYTLGWGGFWFWDPVENASLMPWLAGTAFLHSAIVMEKREALKVWTVFLAILAFSLSLLGTFLVRSGVLTSVHAFAEDPRRGVFILAIEAFFIGGAFALFALRAPALKQGAIFAPLSREGFLVANNVLLFAACVTVVVGTLYPLVLQATTGQKITVGAPYFNTLVGALFAGVCLLLPFGHQLAWKRGDLLGVTQRLAVVALAAVAAALVLGAAHGFAPATSVIAAGLAIFVALGAFLEIGRRAFGGGFSPALVIARTRGLPLAAWAAFFAHLGFGIGLLGVAATGWGDEAIVSLRAGGTAHVGPYALHMAAFDTRKGANFTADVVRFDVSEGGRAVATVSPARRHYPVRNMDVAQAGIVTLGLGQVYVSVGAPDASGIPVRAFWKPLVTLIWIGGLVAAFGGALGFAGTLSKRRARKVFAAAPLPQAAE